jgi:Tfp pilus assembly protein PilN
MRLQVAYRSEGRLTLAPLSESPGSRRGEVIVPAPEDYHAFILPLPSLSEDAMEGLLRFRLRSEYPGEVDSLFLSYHRLDGGDTVVLAMDRAIRAEYHSLKPNARLVTAETMLLVARRSHEGAVSCDSWRIAVRRDPFSRTVDYGDAFDARDTALADLPRPGSPRMLEDFGEQHHRRSWWGARMAVAVIACLVLAATLVYRDVQGMQRVVARRSQRFAQLSSRMDDANSTIRRAEELEARIAALPGEDGAEPYHILSALAEVAAGGVEITDLSLRGPFLKITAVAADALRFADRLSADRRFDAVQLVRVQSTLDGADRLSLTGVFEP